MKAKPKQSGMSLVELTVVVAAVAMLAFFAVPAAKKFLDSFGSTGSAGSMIEAAISSARAIAAKEHRYAGIRFQFDKDGPLKGNQYMIFIIHDPEATGQALGRSVLANGFRALKGVEPVKLPITVGVMDLEYYPALPSGSLDTLVDTTSFSIIFSPSGKLVIHPVRVSRVSEADEVFNIESKVLSSLAMFFQDDTYSEPLLAGLVEEPSRNSFIIYEGKKFENAKKQGDVALSQYLGTLQPMYVNAYTGTIISRD